jgi:hypothetical protein
MKIKTTLILFFYSFLFLIAQQLTGQILPDTLHYNHNQQITGTSWSFTAAHISDIHLGEDSPDGDYGTIGWNDTINDNTYCSATGRLRNVVHWINANAEAEKIEIVFVTGDVSDRAEKSGFIMTKRILDSLIVPYVVTNGNHDMWPRVIGDQASEPFGDSIFAEVYSDHFDFLSQELDDWDDGTRLNRVYNPINDIYSQFQNFSFSKGSYRFMVNDFASRFKKPVGPGTMINAKLYNIPGGTYPWLANAMEQTQPQISNGIIWLQHFPFDDEFLSATYSFNNAEHDSLIDLIEGKDFGLCIAGHRHRNKVYDIKRSGTSTVLGVGIETDANFEYSNGFVRMIRFWDYSPTSSLTDLNQSKKTILFPNPANEFIYIDYPQLKNSTIYVYDTLGKLLINTVISDDSHQLDISNLSNGTYFIKISNQDEILSSKFVVGR